MMMSKLKYATLLATGLTLAGCASSPGGSIYVPIGGSQPREQAPEPPRSTQGSYPESAADQGYEEDEPVVSQPAPERDSSSRPSYQDQSEALSPAAASLIRQADNLLASGDARGAVSQLERAQRIAPRSPEVYFKLSEAYVAMNQLGSAEQFTLKGLSLAGSDSRLQRTGWLLLADIRRARGNTAGAREAESRAAML